MPIVLSKKITANKIAVGVQTIWIFSQERVVEYGTLQNLSCDVVVVNNSSPKRLRSHALTN
jgi:hypothetical protein